MFLCTPNLRDTTGHDSRRYINLAHIAEALWAEWPDTDCDEDTGKPLKAGCRLSLTFQEMYSGGAPKQAAFTGDAARALKRLLDQVARHPKE